MPAGSPIRNPLWRLAFCKMPIHVGTRPSDLIGKSTRNHVRSAIFNPHIGSDIPLLLPSRGPAAIFRFVISIVVHTINAVMSGWLAAHVLQKSLETSFATPPITNSNSSSTIISVSTSPGVVASRNQIHPAVVLGRAALAVYSYRLNPFASAACGSASTQGVRPYRGKISAITKAFSHCLSIDASSHSDDNQSSIPITRKVNSPIF